MAIHAQAKSARLRALADDAQRAASELTDLAGQVDQPSRSIERADRLIAAGERIASDLSDVACAARSVFRG